jgi:hypothetical protein
MKLIITAFAALASVVSATMDYTCDISVNFSSKNVSLWALLDNSLMYILALLVRFKIESFVDMDR